jgi:hypothetical protein
MGEEVHGEMNEIVPVTAQPTTQPKVKANPRAKVIVTGPKPFQWSARQKVIFDTFVETGSIHACVKAVKERFGVQLNGMKVKHFVQSPFFRETAQYHLDKLAKLAEYTGDVGKGHLIGKIEGVKDELELKKFQAIAKIAEAVGSQDRGGTAQVQINFLQGNGMA